MKMKRAVFGPLQRLANNTTPTPGHSNCRIKQYQHKVLEIKCRDNTPLRSHGDTYLLRRCGLGLFGFYKNPPVKNGLGGWLGFGAAGGGRMMLGGFAGGPILQIAWDRTSNGAPSRVRQMPQDELLRRDGLGFVACSRQRAEMTVCRDDVVGMGGDRAVSDILTWRES